MAREHREPSGRARLVSALRRAGSSGHEKEVSYESRADLERGVEPARAARRAGPPDVRNLMSQVDEPRGRSRAPMSPTPRSWDLTRIVLGVAAIGGLVAASFWVLRPFLPALVWATMIVVATWPAFRAVEARLWGKRSLAVAIMTLAMLMIVVAPVAVGVTTVVEHTDTIAAWSKSLAEFVLAGPPDRVRSLPFAGERIATEWQRMASAEREDLTAQITPYLKGIALWILGQAGG